MYQHDATQQESGPQSGNQFYVPQYNNQYQPYQQNQIHQPQLQAHFPGHDNNRNNIYSLHQAIEDDFPPDRAARGHNDNHGNFDTPHNGYGGHDDPKGDTIEPKSIFMQVQQEDKPSKQEKFEIEEKYTPKDTYQPQKTFRRSITSWGTPTSLGGVKTCLAFTSIFVNLILVIALMIYHFAKKDLQLSSISGGLDYIAFNLNSNPIIDLVPGFPSCPPGYETIHLGSWPGTVDGCNCPIFGLDRGDCTKKEDKYGCTDISDVDPIELYNYDGSPWCAKRAAPGSEYIKTPTCPKDFKECSPGMCMANSVLCPVTFVNLTNTGSVMQQLRSSGRYVKLYREQGKPPLVNLKVSLGTLPCFGMNEEPKGKGDYVLFKQFPSGCSSYGVDSFFSYVIDGMTQDQLFLSNNFPQDALNLPDYRKIFQVTPVVLAGRNRITVANNVQCLAINTQLISNAAVAAGDLNRYMSGTAITAMVIHGILFVLTCIALCSLKSNYSWEDIMKGKESGMWLFSYIPLGIMEIIVFIVMAALVSSARSTMTDSTDYLVKLDKAGCFLAGPPRKVIADYDDLVDQTANTLHSFSIALLSISLITYIIVTVIICYKASR